MKETYYVRRSEFHRPSLDINNLITRMSTPKKMDAFKNASDSAINHPGYHYYVFKGEQMLGWFYTEEEN